MEISEIRAQFDVPARMRDGTVLYANVFSPVGGGPYPVALSRTPYNKDGTTSFPYLDVVRMAQAGYIVVVQDVRGRFRSEGKWALYASEAEDGYDSVEWAARLPGSNGCVGMWGISYLAYAQWAAAGMRPPSLKAIMPAFVFNDGRDGESWRGGALELGILGHLLLPSLGYDTLVKQLAGAPTEEIVRAVGALIREIDGLPKGGYASLPLSDFAPLRTLGLNLDQLADLVDNPNAPKFSQKIHSLTDSVRRAQVPTYAIGGWYDIFLKGTLDNYRLTRAAEMERGTRQSRLIVGPWSHVTYTNLIGDVDFGMNAQMAMIDGKTDMVGLSKRWFDTWLKGEDTGLSEEPPVKIFVMGINTWRDETDWPLARAKPSAFFMQPGAGLATDLPPAGAAPSEYTYDPRDPAPTLGGNILMNPVYGPGAKDQRPIENRPDVISFTSAPLEAPLEVIGELKVRLWAATSAPDTDFVARLVDVHPDGFAQNLADGILRLRYRDPDRPELAEPDRPYCLEIDLWATANVFLPGHRIRVDVTSSCFPRWDRNPNTGDVFGRSAALCSARQRIFHDADHPSYVILPVIG